MTVKKMFVRGPYGGFGEMRMFRKDLPKMTALKGWQYMFRDKSVGRVTANTLKRNPKTVKLVRI